MKMLFCPKCGSIMKPEKKKGKKVMACSCGYSTKKADTEIKEKIKNKKKEVEVVSDEQEKSLPTTDADCPECDNTKAYYWMVQTRAGDEPETKFLRCTKCKHTWRDYS